VCIVDGSLYCTLFSVTIMLLIYIPQWEMKILCVSLFFFLSHMIRVLTVQEEMHV
jgi:hypothetical protein